VQIKNGYINTFKGLVEDYLYALGKIMGGFFKIPEYCCCYPSPCLTYKGDQDDVKNFNSIKFSGFNPESMGKVGIDLNNFYSKNLQLHLQDYNTYILEAVDNIATAGTIPWMIVGIIILSCVIVTVIITLILYMLPWWKYDNGQPVMPGPYHGLRPHWPNSPKPKPLEPAVKPLGPNPSPFPPKDPGKK
jgi:hypothetical protein